ncbi:NAD-dependent protein deacetylase sirtuin-7 [Protopterus annectens]|uniref:NAD-dependent protein deacetylase sirtuin-7 n=1 Tax=Protopterus annectens TaxID=7888 RepID=UPI001CFBEDF5|nr:NAD-dependent protein deacetylase sirtuin-7 [Protopterus annectens]
MATDESATTDISSRAEMKARQRLLLLQQEERRALVRLVSKILNKPVEQCSPDELAVMDQNEDIVCELRSRKKKNEQLKRKLKEVTDDPEDVKTKAKLLACAIREASYVVIYTGAGISTAASIPDYRGPNGVWTMLQKGQSIRSTDLSEAEPTFTHMAIAKLHQEKLVQHVVSQNCDGLHLRSGLPRHALSELHGNMYIEVCTSCSPNVEYIRLFDVTEKTSLHRHNTSRKCHKCQNGLRDTIVHFGERGTLEQPLNWKGAAEAAAKADVILCLGSSLKVLKKYPCLWNMNRPPCRRPKLYIVNLQWTPKDDFACLKIHGKCDDVMQLVMEDLFLDVPQYDKCKDPIFKLAVPLTENELSSHSRKWIVPSEGINLPENKWLQDTLEADPGEASSSGGWFGRGCSKGQKKKKKLT